MRKPQTKEEKSWNFLWVTMLCKLHDRQPCWRISQHSSCCSSLAVEWFSCRGWYVLLNDHVLRQFDRNVITYNNRLKKKLNKTAACMLVFGTEPSAGKRCQIEHFSMNAHGNRTSLVDWSVCELHRVLSGHTSGDVDKRWIYLLARVTSKFSTVLNSLRLPRLLNV